ncbi:hypothetical protein SAMN05421805_1011480 [Saccharopolyspora antimicrobica]|uniref:Uncharacterized protein n=1 Tax=Saccharopolyspora antimicrobica TaxID=455193 RepID=A0A1I4TL97_9PSEU|nr:hypothetical protein [Saccharopolyspora antimicrobica]RKT88460.1 hypothetical protein ATL45_6894 [Saccharopolyspora antimicrobica]SFM77504.1 hypothetical protein SAMN05421805_1011480 [Saccharopolyspora antimicrobica]
MGNSISSGDRDIYMSNGGTEVFAEVMALAVAATAERRWDFRFAAAIAKLDQNVMGRGAVGFGLEDVDWGDTAEEQEANRRFVLRTVNLALSRHRWDELGYDPPFAAGFLRDFREMVLEFDMTTPARFPGDFPDYPEVLPASCVEHRVLSPLEWYRACVFCGG